MVHCGMWYWCIVGFVQQVYCNPFPVQCNCKRSFWVWTDWTQPMRLRDSNFVILSSTGWAYTQNTPHNHSRYMDLVKWQTVLLKTISHIWLEPYPEWSLQSICCCHSIISCTWPKGCSQWSVRPIQVAGPLAWQEIGKSLKYHCPRLFLILRTMRLSCLALLLL